MKQLNSIKQFTVKLFRKVFKPKEKVEETFYRLKQDSGQSCYELNLHTKVLKFASFESFKVDGIVKKRLKVNANCIYCIAINEKNAIRKFRQQVSAMLNNKKQ